MAEDRPGSKRENQKYKALLVAKYLLENSDADHPFNASDISDYLMDENGITTEHKSIHQDTTVISMNEEDAFIVGFRLGAKIILDVLERRYPE